MVANGNDAIQSGLINYPETVQSAAEIIARSDQYIADNNAKLAAILNRMANSG